MSCMPKSGNFILEFLSGHGSWTGCTATSSGNTLEMETEPQFSETAMHWHHIAVCPCPDGCIHSRFSDSVSPGSSEIHISKQLESDDSHGFSGQLLQTACCGAMRGIGDIKQEPCICYHQDSPLLAFLPLNVLDREHMSTCYL